MYILNYKPFVNSINENVNRQLIYSENYEYGSIDGIIHKDWNYVKNWFFKYGEFEENERIFKELKEMVDLPIAFLNNINVDDDYRGSGRGNELYDGFEDWALENNASCILLISDSDESQVDGFVLDKWYYSKGFEKIGVLNGNTVMIKYDFI